MGVSKVFSYFKKLLNLNENLVQNEIQVVKSPLTNVHVAWEPVTNPYHQD